MFDTDILFPEYPVSSVWLTLLVVAGVHEQDRTCSIHLHQRRCSGIGQRGVEFRKICYLLIW